MDRHSVNLVGMHQPNAYANPYGQPKLTCDVLHEVCNHVSDVADVLSLALTCSMLMEDTLRRRLKISPITLNLLNAQWIYSFHAFVFSNEPARAPHIYGLKLMLQSPYPYDIKRMDPSLAQLINVQLVTLLKAALHIRYLCFPTSISDSVLAIVVI